MIGFMRVHVAIYDYDGRFVLECRMFFVKVSFVCVCLFVLLDSILNLKDLNTLKCFKTLTFLLLLIISVFNKMR